MLWSVFDKLLAFATKDELLLSQAKQDFEKHTGSVYADHPWYEEQSDAFLEHYLLEYQRPQGMSWVDFLVRSPQVCSFEAAELPFVQAWKSSYRSLFLLEKRTEERFWVKDLWGGGQFEVSERRVFPGVTAGYVFESRLLVDPSTPYRLLFGKTFLLHPLTAKKSILALVNQAQDQEKTRISLLLQLQRARLQCLQYKHLPASKIYLRGA